MQLCVRHLCFFFWLTVPVTPRHCKKSTRQSVLIRLQGNSSFSVKLPFCPANAHEPGRSAPCTFALNTLHLNLKSTCAFSRNRPACATRSRPWRFAFPSLQRRTYSRSTGCPSVLLSSLSSPQRAPALSLVSALLAPTLIRLLLPR